MFLQKSVGNNMSEKEKTVLHNKTKNAKKKNAFRKVVNIALIILVLLFTLQNLESIRVTLLFFSFEMPLFVLIIVVFSIGFFTTKIFGRNKN
jgi:uncharacterized integral membrane protein